jgi:hypothetical protein
MTNHLTEEQMTLHYYGEPGDAGQDSDALAIERHLESCGECRTVYASIQRVLNIVDSLPVPERSPEYGAEVWKRIEHRLPSRRRNWLALPSGWRWAAASAACAALMVAAFFAGRTYPGAAKPATLAGADPQSRERVLLVAVGDYLERSQMVLIELANADTHAPLDITSEQERAGDLVSETRLYRQTAADTGDTRITGVLDDLERVLVDITHAPSNISPQQLQELRQRLEAEGIIFKIRVLGSNVRNQDAAAAKPAGQPL